MGCNQMDTPVALYMCGVHTNLTFSRLEVVGIRKLLMDWKFTSLGEQLKLWLQFLTSVYLWKWTIQNSHLGGPSQNNWGGLALHTSGWTPYNQGEKLTCSNDTGSLWMNCTAENRLYNTLDPVTVAKNKMPFIHIDLSRWPAPLLTRVWWIIAVYKIAEPGWQD